MLERQHDLNLSGLLNELAKAKQMLAELDPEDPKYTETQNKLDRGNEMLKKMESHLDEILDVKDLQMNFSVEQVAVLGPSNNAAPQMNQQDGQKGGRQAGQKRKYNEGQNTQDTLPKTTTPPRRRGRPSKLR